MSKPQKMTNTDFMDMVVSAIAEINGKTTSEIKKKSPRRGKADDAHLRFVAYYIIRRYSGDYTLNRKKITLIEIADYIGGVDYSCVIHGVKKIKDWLGNPHDHKIHELVNTALKKLGFENE